MKFRGQKSTGNVRKDSKDVLSVVDVSALLFASSIALSLKENSQALLFTMMRGVPVSLKTTVMAVSIDNRYIWEILALR